MSSLGAAREYLAKNRDRFIEEWKQLLSIPSVSTDPAMSKECVRCAEWVARACEQIGFKTSLVAADSGHPILVAERGEMTASEGRSLTIYGHYDVQPADPLELWKTPPFEPTIRDGRVYARGAQDNKGQIWYVIKALEFLHRTGKLGGRSIKLCIEGEEESGSEVLYKALPQLASRLRASTLLVCDTGTLDRNLATITMGLRGIAHCTVELRGPAKDLHSGVHGGVARNPAQAMAQLLSSLYRADGSVAVAGFYDGVSEPTQEEVALASAGAPTAEQYEKLVGVGPFGGERERYPLAVRGGIRPTLEVNGVHSGYGGPGSKTIIPSVAVAKLSFRLVRGQDGAKVLKAVKDHLVSHAGPGVSVVVTEEIVGGPALQVSPKSESVRRVLPGLTELMGGKPPIFRWEGASIPVVSELAKQIGAEPLLVGFGLEEDDIHAPNESFAIEQFERGFLFAANAIEQLTEK